MLSKEERLSFCKRCIHRKDTERYGILCSLTDNFPHFSEKCEYFKSNSIVNTDLVSDIKTKFQIPKAKTSSKKGSLFGKLFLFYIIIKLILKFIGKMKF